MTAFGPDRLLNRDALVGIYSQLLGIAEKARKPRASPLYRSVAEKQQSILIQGNCPAGAHLHIVIAIGFPECCFRLIA